ncbi:TrbI/VirB10 family protein [Sphingopyxis chilensis]|uniref:TrbI/VirB10 family protein n=1 Tax=Sphingopyxis chilensis TaxID=180400 RepID=UPI002DDCF3EA|nr:TrbI/VirB10 family protein [Sphingopyxis chilensis]
MTGASCEDGDAVPRGKAAPPEDAPPKLAPQSLALRGQPARVVRFRRGAIIALAGASAVPLAGAGWFALRSPDPVATGPDDDRAPVAAKSASEVLAGVPTNYGDVPPLGPPLPGDLGRPILARQRQLGMEGAADPAADVAADAAARAAQQAEAERLRIAAEQRAARESGVMMQLANATTRREMADPAAGPEASLPRAGASDDASDPNGQRRKIDLVGRTNRDDDVNPHRLEAAASPWTLHAGTVIAASLITGLNSDLPGLVTAQVTENAYDSVTGRTLLVPQGSRVIGSYDSVVAFGQSRALVVWQRIIFPDGASIRIDNVPASDTAGYAGLADRIDRHTWRLLKGVGLSTLLGVGTELGWGSSESDLVRAVRESAQQAGARAGDQLVARNLDVQPTIKIRPGWPLRIVVHKDIVLKPWEG